MTELSNIHASTRPLAVAAPDPAAVVAPADSRVTLIDERSALVVDARGRSIKIKKPSALDRMRLFKACGAGESENRLFMVYALAAAAVTEFEGIAVAFPMNQLQIEATVARLDEDGLEAVVNGLVALNPEQEGVATAAKNL